MKTDPSNTSPAATEPQKNGTPSPTTNQQSPNTELSDQSLDAISAGVPLFGPSIKKNPLPPPRPKIQNS